VLEELWTPLAKKKKEEEKDKIVFYSVICLLLVKIKSFTLISCVNIIIMY
jgi:hypothetical protein